MPVNTPKYPCPNKQDYLRGLNAYKTVQSNTYKAVDMVKQLIQTPYKKFTSNK